MSQKRNSVWSRVTICVMALWMLMASVGVLQAETTLTVEEFIGLRTKWASLAGTTYQIEGRFSFFSTSQLRMENCDLEFLLARAFPKPAGSSKTILIAGRLEKRDVEGRSSKLVFVVSDLQVQPSDDERFRDMRAKVSSNKPDEWYKLADWAAGRAKFYRDDQLKKDAVQSFRSGVQAEYRSQSQMTAAFLRKLADKLGTWNADPALQVEFLHEALWLDFNASRKDNRGGDGEVLTLITKQLDGASIPLKAEDAALRDRYLAQPQTVFAESDADARKKCARAFYTFVMHARITRDASPDGKNGYAIAARIEREIPEYAAEVPQYRQKERDYQVARVGTMTRKELNELISRFEPLEVPEFVADLKKRWLLAREEHLEPSDVTGLVELGDEYLQLVGDKESAIRIYKKAYAKSPGTQLISDQLTEQGLVLHKGNWVPKGDVPPPPADPLAAAIRDGEVKEGMSADQVRSALGIEPTRRTRVVTSGNVQEWWLYEDHGLSIQFTRRRRAEAAMVTKVMAFRTSVVPGATGKSKPAVK